MLGFNRFAVVGDEVRFLYNGETREGRVVELGKTFVRLDTPTGFRCFSYLKISQVENLTVA